MKQNINWKELHKDKTVRTANGWLPWAEMKIRAQRLQKKLEIFSF